jgi:tetratricopeptide (TPR) repeat protein
MKRRTMRISFAACFVLFVMSVGVVDSAWALDRLKRKGSGTELRGTVSRISKTEVAMKPSRISQPERKVPVNEISVIRWDKEPADLNLRRNDERNGKLQEALAGYEKALKDSRASQTNLRDDLRFLMARVTAKMALLDPSKIDGAVKKLEAFRTSHSNHFRYYEALEYLVRLYIAKKNYAPLGTIVPEMKTAPWNDYNMMAQNYQARAQRLTGDVDAALESYNAVIDRPANSPSELTRHSEAMLGKAACLHQKKQSTAAVKLIEEAVDQLPVEETAILAEAYIRMGEILRAEAGRLQKQGDSTGRLLKSKEATLAYLHLDVLQNLSREKALHAEALYHLSQLWKTIRHPDRAAEAASRLKTDYPNSEWAKKLSASGS